MQRLRILKVRQESALDDGSEPTGADTPLIASRLSGYPSTGHVVVPATNRTGGPRTDHHTWRIYQSELAA